MSHLQVQDKLKRVDHDPGYPCAATVSVTRQILIGAYGTYATVTVHFDADADAKINAYRCEQLQRSLADLGNVVSEAASRPRA